MKVKDLMTVPARTCRTGAQLGDAARIMLEEGCGCLAVVDSRGHLAGVLTDRDVCIATGARHTSPWEIPVNDAMTKKVFACLPDDDIDTALVMMKEHHVRRLPVIDGTGKPKGLLSIDDLVRNTGIAHGRLSTDAVIDVLRHVCTPKAALGEMANV